MISAAIVRSRSCESSQLRVSLFMGAPRCRVPSVFDFGAASTSASMEIVVISIRALARRRTPHRRGSGGSGDGGSGLRVWSALFAINRSLYRRRTAAIRRDLAAGDRVAIVRSAIAHNTNRTFRGRTGGGRLRSATRRAVCWIP